MIGVIDYDMGNIHSVAKGLQKVGGEVRVVRTAGELAGCDKIVLPGVAAFGDAMDALGEQGLVEPLIDAIGQGRPYLGFCLGLQLLFDISYEEGEYTGLGVLPGKVVRLSPDPSDSAQPIRVPHMGWNQLELARPCPMLNGIDSGAYVYFAHSYHVVPADERLVATRTDYGGSFVSAVWRDNVFATQFHPEKSQAVGLKLLENFVKQ
jgi:glutamine amidotransferase